MKETRSFEKPDSAIIQYTHTHTHTHTHIYIYICVCVSVPVSVSVSVSVFQTKFKFSMALLNFVTSCFQETATTLPSKAMLLFSCRNLYMRGREQIKLSEMFSFLNKGEDVRRLS